MTYYGRWTYKYEIASEKGAAAAILVHETGPAGYPFEVVKGSWSRENFDIAQPAGGQAPARVAVEGWITFEKATSFSRRAGKISSRSSKPPPGATFAPCRLGCNGQVLDHQRAARSQVAECGRHGSRGAIRRSRTRQ